MFDPLKFLELAKELKPFITNEAKIRTAIGRAYYSAFLFTREWLKTKGWLFYGDGRDHNEAQKGLRKYIGRPIGGKLNYLYRNLRGNADYDLTKSLSERDTDKAIRLSEIVIGAVLRVPPKLNNISNC